MTIVACWLDESYSVTSLAALADARASERVGTVWYTHSDNTIKLFSIDVRCFDMDALTPGLGAWMNPYYETTIGLGFAGHCFEALTVIAHIQRAMGALIIADGKKVQPVSDGLVNLAKEIAERYLRDHKFGSMRDLELLLFGWDGPAQPWIAKLVWDRQTKKVVNTVTKPSKPDVVTIGDGAKASKRFGIAARIRKKIARQLERFVSAPLSQQGAFSQAILEIEASRRMEEGVGALVESQFVRSVGGVRQKLQVAWEGGRAVAAFTADDQPHIMDGLPSVRTDTSLGPVPIVTKMK
ncbi:hypothetical protein [Methylobacterium nodulans]|uniref:Uncharacterized protein n=1 Tax=Methylobacterium nodulans (strain LMG 21967 / CNCM I-2342 / ORS 2060) TaxID=460265 RepID=B8IMQ3_METNO|nr:hypothetical protein [Methylobacterium nodulans]ACL60246.1 hypothetical protein Mnod_5402 [Methylobacterium nodulans ORS 2060]